ncbi:FadR/GntR family transcriptional regulator [Martelella alba]|uniref:FadR family transcriptional regulator n=1 Tax=Martelella alba TaxID=2590451 RepID=A0ABY2STR7_9HYPH|nr:FadR/GntR family transcriptional regulator [Martelella alba]TKI08526.1 FadR family transcriptional regulator [Martelella alba]
MSIESIKKHNVVNEIYEQMKLKILDGTWHPGSKLPSEAELTRSFNVSRVSIRSAVQRLRDMGIVITQHGRGSFVSEGLNHQSLLQEQRPIVHLSHEEFHDMMVFRQTVEFKCISLAVEHAADADIARMEAALNRMLVNKDDYKKYSLADYEFHLAIAQASHNLAFFNALSALKEMYCYYLEEISRTLGISLESIEAHIKVFMSIKNKDAETAIQVMKDAMMENVINMDALKTPLANENAPR